MSSRQRRWERRTTNMQVLKAPHREELQSRLGVQPSEPHSGRLIEDGIAYYPIMSDDEVAAISVPASAPSDQVRSTLVEHGVCLVTDVLTQSECHDLESLWNADLVSVLGSAKEDANKAAIKALREQGSEVWPGQWSHVLGKKGCVSHRALPHGQFAWSARLHPGIRKIFADIFETPSDNLAVGLDCTFWSATDAPAAESNAEWLHCDQNHRTGLTWLCVQGVLYVWSSEGEKASTTVVWPGSHREVYERIMQDETAIRRGRHMGGQSVRLSQLSDSLLRESLVKGAVLASRRVPCPAGSLLLWDSRTIHQGWAGGPRLAQPVCWEPRQRRECDPDALKRKLFMCAAGLPSSHSSAEARVHGMAPRSQPCEVMEGHDVPPFRAQILPYCISGRKKHAWTGMQKSLWARNAIDKVNVPQFTSWLKPEILDAL